MGHVLFLGVDAATTTGFAVIERPPGGGERVIEARPILSSPENIRAAVERYRGSAKAAVIEDPYLGKNVHTVKILARLVGRWEQQLNLAGVETSLMTPQAWQQGMLSGLIGHNSPRAQRKRMAVLWVRRHFGLSLDSDSADAVCMVTWFARQRAAGRGA